MQSLDHKFDETFMQERRARRFKRQRFAVDWIANISALPAKCSPAFGCPPDRTGPLLAWPRLFQREKDGSSTSNATEVVPFSTVLNRKTHGKRPARPRCGRVERELGNGRVSSLFVKQQSARRTPVPCFYDAIVQVPAYAARDD